MKITWQGTYFIYKTRDCYKVLSGCCSWLTTTTRITAICLAIKEAI